MTQNDKLTPQTAGKLSEIWNLAHTLYDKLEDLRPGGGFKERIDTDRWCMECGMTKASAEKHNIDDMKFVLSEARKEIISLLDDKCSDPRELQKMFWENGTLSQIRMVLGNEEHTCEK